MQKLVILTSFLLVFLTNCTTNEPFTPSQLYVDAQPVAISRFATLNGYMYVLNSNEVLTYSLERPEQPKLIHTLSIDYGFETIIVFENAVYLSSRAALYILGIDNPEVPVILSRSNRAMAFFGGCNPVVVKNNYAYSTVKTTLNICRRRAAENALLVYDVTDKTNPKQVNTYPLFEPSGIGYKDNFLFVCDEGSNEVLVFDITNPPEINNLIDYSISINMPYDLIVANNRMLVSTATDFQMFDISEIANIRRTGKIDK